MFELNECTGTLKAESLYEAATELDLNTFCGRFRIDAESGQQLGRHILLTQWRLDCKVVLSR